MDCQMPEMDGFEAMPNCQRELTGNRVPIIAMTANAMSSDRKRCLDAGMDGYLSKPLQTEALYEVLLPYKINRRINITSTCKAPIEAVGVDIQEALARTLARVRGS